MRNFRENTADVIKIENSGIKHINLRFIPLNCYIYSDTHGKSSLYFCFFSRRGGYQPPVKSIANAVYNSVYNIHRIELFKLYGLSPFHNERYIFVCHYFRSYEFHKPEGVGSLINIDNIQIIVTC